MDNGCIVLYLLRYTVINLHDCVRVYLFELYGLFGYWIFRILLIYWAREYVYICNIVLLIWTPKYFSKWREYNIQYCFFWYSLNRKCKNEISSFYLISVASILLENNHSYLIPSFWILSTCFCISFILPNKSLDENEKRTQFSGNEMMVLFTI